MSQQLLSAALLALALVAVVALAMTHAISGDVTTNALFAIIGAISGTAVLHQAPAAGPPAPPA